MNPTNRNILKPLPDSASFPFPNPYVQLMHSEFSPWTFDQNQAPLQKGLWHELLPSAHREVDLEIGTGNGLHFAHRAINYPDRLIIGIELKFKPLVQSIRRAVKQGCSNARMVRYDARRIDDLFTEGEISNVFIHFPDPWVKKKQQKKRLLNAHFFQMLFQLQKPEGLIEIKTDNFDYFQSIITQVKSSNYRITSQKAVLPNVSKNDGELEGFNYITQFERLFLKQGLPIYHLNLTRI